MRIKDIPEQNRPRERFVRCGAGEENGGFGCYVFFLDSRGHEVKSSLVNKTYLSTDFISSLEVENSAFLPFS